MKSEPYPAEEVGHEYHPLTGFWCGDDLPFNREPMGDFRSQVPRLPKLRDILLGDRGGCPPTLGDGSGHN